MENQHPHICGCKKIIIKSLASVLILLFLILSVSSVVDIFNKIKEGKYIGQSNDVRNSISISETGEVYAVPDLGIINLSVITEAKTVEVAMEKNTQDMNNIIQAMKDQGIEGKDLKTTSFNIYPRYDYSENYNKRTLSGYEINQQLQVKIRDLEKIGAVIQEATNAGANDVSQLQLTIDDQDKLKEEARNQAIEKAKVKAEALTSQLGVKLGKVITFNENSSSPVYPMYESYDSSMKGLGGATPDIQSGENKISIGVTITYEIY